MSDSEVKTSNSTVTLFTSHAVDTDLGSVISVIDVAAHSESAHVSVICSLETAAEAMIATARQQKFDHLRIEVVPQREVSVATHREAASG